MQLIKVMICYNEPKFPPRQVRLCGLNFRSAYGSRAQVSVWHRHRNAFFHATTLPTGRTVMLLSGASLCSDWKLVCCWLFVRYGAPFASALSPPGRPAPQSPLPSFVKYEPSSREQLWISRIEGLDPIDGCKTWGPGAPLQVQTNEEASTWADSDHRSKLIFSSLDDGLLSSDLEPLTGWLRHPLALTSGHKNRRSVMDKNWLVLPTLEDLHRVRAGGGRLLFFDIGASLYNFGPGGENGASLQWFIEEFKRISPEWGVFDEIYAWEAEPYHPYVLWRDIPADVVPRIRYYNVKADPKPGANMDPWRILSLVARPVDYVVVKLDVDHQRTELSLINRLLDSKDQFAVGHLIDEIFWEHHVAGSAMQCPYLWREGNASGWKTLLFNTTYGSQETLVESYGLFSRLRERGIRAHSWV